MIDLDEIWQRAKQGESISEQEIVAAERILRSEWSPKRDLAILIVGVTRNQTPLLISMVEGILRGSSDDTERRSSLKVLCRYWGLWGQYLEYVLQKISPAEFESDPEVSREAFNLVGDYLSNFSNSKVWRRVFEVYQTGMSTGKVDLAREAYSALYVGVVGSKETLLRQIQKKYRENDEDVLGLARIKARLGD